VSLHTKWRRERDSNPRYGFPYSGFQDKPCHAPLSRISSLHSGWLHQKWVNITLFGNICSPLCSPRTDTAESSGSPSRERCCGLRQQRSRSGCAYPIPRTRLGRSYGYQWAPDFFAWWTRHQSGNDRVSTEGDYWQPNTADVESDFSSQQIKLAMWQIPETRIPNRDSRGRKSAGKIDCPALEEPQPR